MLTVDWSTRAAWSTTPDGNGYLGRLGRGRSASLNIEGLSPGAQYLFTFDLMAIGSWDGATDRRFGGEQWRLDVNGVSPLRAWFDHTVDAKTRASFSGDTQIARSGK